MVGGAHNMSLEGMMAALAAGGSPFDEQGARDLMRQEAEREQAEARAEAEIVARALNNDAGRAFMAWLIKRTLHRPPNAGQQTAATAEAYALACAKREGQNAIVFTIFAALATAGVGTPATDKDLTP